MRLSCCLLNVENLFIFLNDSLEKVDESWSESQWQKFSSATVKNKPLKKIFHLSSEFRRLNPDLILLTEVGGMESLSHLNRLFLDGCYTELLIEGNSDRLIDVGFLLRKNLPLRGNLVSNKDRKINYLYDHEHMSQLTGYDELVPPGGSHKFSRDACELHLVDSVDMSTKAVFILTHLKSKLDPEGVDPDGKKRRKAELETLLEVYKEVNFQYKNQIPVFVCGDFNGNASRSGTDDEFLPIYRETSLEDIFELAGLQREQRATFYQVRPQFHVDFLQLDYVFISKDFISSVDIESVRVCSYRNKNGFDLKVPLTLDQKGVFPSDHNPVVFDVLI